MNFKLSNISGNNVYIKKKLFQEQKKNRPSEDFRSGNKRFIRKRMSQSLKSSAEKIQAKMAKKRFIISEKQFYSTLTANFLPIFGFENFTFFKLNV